MHFGEKKIGECIPCLKYSVPIFVELIYKMRRLEVSGAVRPLYGSLGVKGLNLSVFVMLTERFFSEVRTEMFVVYSGYIDVCQA